MGISEQEEAVYRVVLAGSHTAADIARIMRLSRKIVEAMLESLVGSGLVSKSLGASRTYAATPPDAAVAALVLHRQRELEQARLLIPELVERFRSGLNTVGAEHLVEVVSGAEAVAARLEERERLATEEILVLDRPPYIRTGDPQVELARVSGLLERGISIRVVYDPRGLEEAGHLPVAEQMVALGEQGRLLDDLPLKLVIVDRKVGILPVNLEGPAGPSALFVYPSGLLDALIAFFENLWARALPMPSGTAVSGDDDDDVLPTGLDRRILAWLASGVKESVVARELDTSERTVQRRIATLLNHLGARTKLQLIAEAVRRGWV